MLEVRMNKGETMINVCGSPAEIMSDMALLLRVLYEKLDKDNKEFFEESLKRIVKDKIYAKTEEEMEELNKKQIDRLFSELLKNENAEEVLKKLKDLFK